MRRIAIVGAGPAGLTAALAARRLGLEPVVFEQAADFRRIGGGIMLHSNGLRVLEALGLRASFAPEMRVTQTLDLELAGGRVLSRFDYAAVSVPLNQAAVVMRYSLQEHLLAAALRERIPIHFGHRCTGAELGQGEVGLTFAHGARHEAALVLACDGLRSVIREAAGLRGRVRPIPEAYLRGVSPVPPRDERVREIWGNDGRRFGICPLPGDRTYFFCSVPLGGWEAIRARELDRWIDGWAPISEEARAVLRAVEDWERVNYSELSEVRLGRWWSGRLFVVGDAAHAMTPNLGQGANSAMVDAWVLMRMLAGSDGSPASLERVGAAYDAVRRPFVTQVQRAAGWLGKLAGLRSAPARAVRNQLIAWGGQPKASASWMVGFNPEEERYFTAAPSP